MIPDDTWTEQNKTSMVFIFLAERNKFSQLHFIWVTEAFHFKIGQVLTPTVRLWESKYLDARDLDLVEMLIILHITIPMKYYAVCQ